MLWQDASNDRVDLWRAIYDPTLELWSHPQQLTADDRMEHAVAPVYTASGDLVAVYDKVPTVLQARTVIVDGEEIEVQVPVPDQTDLYMLRHVVTGDLALRSEDVDLSDPATLLAVYGTACP